MRILICHASTDTHHCFQFADTFLSMEDVYFGPARSPREQMSEHLLKRVEWCECCLYLLTTNAYESDKLRNELQIAISLHKPIIPILIDKTSKWPDELLDLPYVDFSDGPTLPSVKWLGSHPIISTKQN